jgi:hypothetical protein
MTANNQERKDRQEQLLSRVNFENCISTIIESEFSDVQTLNNHLNILKGV